MATNFERIELHVTEEQKALIEQAAASRGQSISEYVASAALECARGVDTTVLSRRDWDEALRIFDADDAPTAALIAAARKHRKDS